MKKIRLDVDALRVDSFATAPVDGPRGTVQAHATQGMRPTCSLTCTNTQPLVSCYDPCG